MPPEAREPVVQTRKALAGAGDSRSENGPKRFLQARLSSHSWWSVSDASLATVYKVKLVSSRFQRTRHGLAIVEGQEIGLHESRLRSHPWPRSKAGQSR